MFVDQPEADVEDLLGRPLYIDVVNRCYKLTGSRRLKATRPKDAPGRVVKEVEQHFKLLADVNEFDDFSPASFLLENREDFASSPALEDALGRFERLFETVNSFLGA